MTNTTNDAGRTRLEASDTSAQSACNGLLDDIFCFVPFFTPIKNASGVMSTVYRGKCRLRAYITKRIDGAAIAPIEVGTPVVITAIQPLHIGDASKYSMCTGIVGITELWNDEFILVDGI